MSRTIHPVAPIAEPVPANLLVRLAGCQIVEQTGRVVLVRAPNQRALLNLLAYRAAVGAHADDVRAIAANLRRPHHASNRVHIGELIQRYVRTWIQFAPEPIETFVAPGMLLTERVGDCDDHACLVAALGLACGLRADLVGFWRGARCHHVTAALDGAYAETTVDARYGEDPLAAASRLGLTRGDL